jgi:hypothetical protein
MRVVAVVLSTAVRKVMVLAAGVMVVLVMVMLVLWELQTQAAVVVVGQTQLRNKVMDTQVGQALLLFLFQLLLIQALQQALQPSPLQAQTRL